VWSVLFIWLNETNQMNQLNQIIQTNQTDQMNQFGLSASGLLLAGISLRG
jgi:hypothetical protein